MTQNSPHGGANHSRIRRYRIELCRKTKQDGTAIISFL